MSAKAIDDKRARGVAQETEKQSSRNLYEELERRDRVPEKKAPMKKEEKPKKPEHPKEKESGKGFVATYWLLIVGLVLAAAGVFGIVGLRLNVVQIYILGIQNPFSGIGSQEPQGHIGSIVPFAIGIVAICAWDFLPGKGEAPEEPEEKGEPAKKEAPAPRKPAEDEEFGFEHLPSSELSPEDRISGLERAFAAGKVSKGLYGESLANYEKALKAERDTLPKVGLTPQEKLDQLEDAYALGSVSKATYERLQPAYRSELDAETAKGKMEEEELLKGDLTADEKEEVSLKELHHLLDDLDLKKDPEDKPKKKDTAFEEKILNELEEL
ncbi:MAG: hypothetical protein HZB92_02090 [Euryarchaeota archaeon]|nr:hypothetical protein [Euryarchaeota archaeon]